MSSTPSPVGHITRTMRAAVKVGDDYFTIEEQITLPIGADEETIGRDGRCMTSRSKRWMTRSRPCGVLNQRTATAMR
jgi:hypothetical protein